MTTTPTLDPVLAVLLELRKRLENPDNWCRWPADESGARCVGLHVANILGDLSWPDLMFSNHRAVVLLAKAIRQYEGWPMESSFSCMSATSLIAMWNDAYATHESVLAVTELAVSLRVEELEGEGLPAFLMKQAG